MLVRGGGAGGGSTGVCSTPDLDQHTKSRGCLIYIIFRYKNNFV